MHACNVYIFSYLFIGVEQLNEFDSVFPGLACN